ncbi:hypothetical protein [Peribacillus frigoritolerans]|uniref:hypothetical protein n=1 Tax=Peribacillus frigoritolerans TaxID=450367 RepID=UPI0032E3EFC7
MTLVASLISMIFITDERKKETAFFFGSWLSLAAFTLIGSIVFGLIGAFILNLVV